MHVQRQGRALYKEVPGNLELRSYPRWGEGRLVLWRPHPLTYLLGIDMESGDLG